MAGSRYGVAEPARVHWESQREPSLHVRDDTPVGAILFRSIGFRSMDRFTSACLSEQGV